MSCPRRSASRPGAGGPTCRRRIATSYTSPPWTWRFGPPSVRYRGIFLNDEDWGLQPWAAHTFEPETGNIGPKTYARVFDLLLRLKANTLWPAMHPTTALFNGDPANAKLADRYAIVMGSSHAEPMLRNNVGEWKDPAETYNYATNPDGVLAYWRERVAANGGYENLYTLGMRGIHDSGMVGASDLAGPQGAAGDDLRRPAPAAGRTRGRVTRPRCSRPTRRCWTSIAAG